jgi:hypothetical protein
MADIVVLRTFSYRHEAEPLRSFLEASGIEAFVGSDDCAALDPALGMVRGSTLSVWERDVEQAEALLAAVEQASSQG